MKVDEISRFPRGKLSPGLFVSYSFSRLKNTELSTREGTNKKQSS